ncbi:hypothetical protein SAMN04488505_109127 [Chitinophaga rupis]|uniref:Uncharacterized protein n=1 Tax=Chitinophaga rupis TaxID=573321 RepID=A0A1H8F7L5_9BACT|nr:hypothetical protein [Chitinophaga rupis]SEN27719.1 hypothetical protein SAMN04488505_109127 [Chitinophaga rupis]
MKFKTHKHHFLLPLIQIVFFIFLYEQINFLAHKMQWINSRGVAWGISIRAYAIIYVLIVLIAQVLTYFLAQRILLVTVISSVVFIGFIIPVLDSYPYRGVVVILIGVAGIFINYLASLIRTTGNKNPGN